MEVTCDFLTVMGDLPFNIEQVQKFSKLSALKMKNNFRILILLVILALLFISTDTCALNENNKLEKHEENIYGTPSWIDKNISFEKENFTLHPPPGFNESDPKGFI
ncbi:hypothetical protein MSIBF_A310002 [groundwater metagenome]|uniref:Uncharacterized protein n=1 Tax=groundwater metagenome TaxID=717931 RepID=A0A098EAI4_9ZZZZ